MEAEKASLTLQEFCDMNQLYTLLDNWSKSCGMATMLVDAKGFPVSEDFGMTEFLQNGTVLRKRHCLLPEHVDHRMRREV